MRVIIDGGAGSGKSTVSKAVAKRFKLRRVAAGEKFRALAKRLGFSTEGEDYLKFHEYQRRHLEIDLELDKLILNDLKRGDWVLDSRIGGRLYQGKVFKVLLRVPDEVAAERNALREGVSRAEALRAVIKRNKEDALRYKRLYGIDLSDTSLYNLVLDTSRFSIKEMNSIVVYILSKLFK